jgi:hypothetical protein
LLLIFRTVDNRNDFDGIDDDITENLCEVTKENNFIPKVMLNALNKLVKIHQGGSILQTLSIERCM